MMPSMILNMKGRLGKKESSFLSLHRSVRAVSNMANIVIHPLPHVVGVVDNCREEHHQQVHGSVCLGRELKSLLKAY